VQLEVLGEDVDFGNALLIGFDVPQVTGMVFGMIRAAVLLSIGIEVSAGGFAIRTAQIAELMDVKTMFPRRQSSHASFETHAVLFLSQLNDSLGFLALGRTEHRDRLLRNLHLDVLIGSWLGLVVILNID